MSGERRWGGLRGVARRSGRRTWLRHRLLLAAEIWMFVRFDSTELDFPSSAPRPVFCGMEGRDRCEAQGLGFSVFRDGFEVLPHRTGAGTLPGDSVSPGFRSIAQKAALLLAACLVVVYGVLPITLLSQ